MTDQGMTAPEGAQLWKPKIPNREPNKHVAYGQIGGSGSRRLKLDTDTFYVPPEHRSNAVQGGSGISSSESPIREEGITHVSQAPQILVFEA